ncbi:30S ribosomal protein S3 [endosymbiont GvMRE of Glomus versiforme]|uniref:30S ribosomal protein S3 n=1 Tax=endosymbiont GvMRE of Glomus versiforme TaxID=2039283 RepID=UPI000EC373F6|nr:30S ribosomal protein S3 [endosymbiont GvMRE of Glomus versiforme]RHZ35963.1 30S ribosomal protein S3 [endosymbiont GvMRE of Glomus versiforme]
MGQKASAYALRLGLNQPWQSNYFPVKKKQAYLLQQDWLIRKYLFFRFPEITKIRIERTEVELFIFVHSPNVSLITGESNDNSDQILTKIVNIVNDKKNIIKLHLTEEKDLAQAIANDLARKLESRIAWNSLRHDLLRKIAYEKEIKGIKIQIKGCLEKGGIAQRKKTSQGRMPSSTLIGLVEEAKAEAHTLHGQIGIKVKTYKGKKKKLKYVNT